MNISTNASLTPTSIQHSARQISPENKTGPLSKDEQNTDKPFNKAQGANALSEQDIKKIQELKARDREVRAHEAAHLSAAGNLAKSAANYHYQRGPDGVQYAVGGEVSIDTSAIAGDPSATLEKAQRIRAAALAPARPSSQDLNVAAQAAQLAVQARAEISQQQRTESTAESTATNGDGASNTEERGQIRNNRNAETEQQAQTTLGNTLNASNSPEKVLDLIV